MIEARGLSKGISPVLAVDDLRFTTASGQVTGFLGPSSTARQRRCGLGAPTTGTVTVTVDGRGHGHGHGHGHGAFASRWPRSARFWIPTPCIRAAAPAIISSGSQTPTHSRRLASRRCLRWGAHRGGTSRRRSLLARHASAARYRSDAARRHGGAGLRRADQRSDARWARSSATWWSPRLYRRLVHYATRITPKRGTNPGSAA
jgi:hypothetical protein